MNTSGANTGLIFSIVIVLVLLVLVYAIFRLFCSTKGQIAGYWTSTEGDLFEIFQHSGPGPQNGDYVVATASGFLGATSDGMYPVVKKGCRSLSISFPNGELRGRVGLDRRRVIWDYAPTWYRQGI